MGDSPSGSIVDRKPRAFLDERPAAEAPFGLHDESGKRSCLSSSGRGDRQEPVGRQPTESHGKLRDVREAAHREREQIMLCRGRNSRAHIDRLVLG